VTEGIVYANADPAQTLSIYLPPEEHQKPFTLLVFGGEGFPELVEYFIESGYPVITFRARDDSYLTETQDGFCALAWAHANAETYGFPAEGIIPVGGSMWGGNAAILGLAKDPLPFLEECPHTLPKTDRVRGVITLAGVFDYSEADDFFEGFIKALSDFMGGTPDQVPDNWAAGSAINWVNGNDPPFLIIHGKVDTNVSKHQSEKFATALETNGTDMELVLLPGINHNTSVTSPKVFEAMQLFLEELEQPSISQETSQPDTSPSVEADTLTITIIYDNYLQDERLTAEWGFAAIVEYNNHVLLFDTGGSATVLKNMQILGIDPKTIEAIVLSHEHGDHIGGLQSLLAETNQPTVYMLATFSNNFKNAITARTNVVEITDSLEIFPNIHTTGEVVGAVREQALVIKTDQGSVIITGCAHPGIVKMVRRGRSILQPDDDVDIFPVRLVIGGFHLGSASRSRIEKIADDLQSLNVQQISPTHCSGDIAIEIFAESYGERFVTGGVGTVIILP
jgi:7,8-dihydropterin-6-yl-methyl-4-(beta-D-ribofuranosyl)aminobenzene 5'-phosphate synthase